MFNPFKKNYSKKELALMNFLSKTRYFGPLTSKEQLPFLPFMYLRSYRQNEVVFFAGDPSHALYMVKEGVVDLTIDVNGDVERIAAIPPKGTFGDNVLLPKTQRIYTAITRSESTELYVIPQINIMDIVAGRPVISSKMMTAFAQCYNEYTADLFKTYQSDFGFFELRKAYRRFSHSM